jgi:hypothetical protein
MSNEIEKDSEVTMQDVGMIFRSWWVYLLSKWKFIGSASFLVAVLGILYAWNQKPLYTAEITFAPENDKSSGMGMYAGIASQFGLDIGSGGGVFEGDNLIEFLKSRMLIEKALFSPVKNKVEHNLLIHQYLTSHKITDKWSGDTSLKNISFFSALPDGSRVRDSILNKIVGEIRKNLTIDKLDKKVNIIVARIQDPNELFAKAFLEQLVINGIDYYVSYRNRKTKETVQILQRQTDSVRGLLSGSIVSVAAASDLNVNPVRQVVRANIQRRQVDVQVNGQLYGELVKQLELAKISLLKETPLIQIIDTPRFPLEKKKLGRLKGGFIFGLVGFLLCIGFFVFKRVFSVPSRVYHTSSTRKAIF